MISKDNCDSSGVYRKMRHCGIGRYVTSVIVLQTFATALEIFGRITWVGPRRVGYVWAADRKSRQYIIIYPSFVPYSDDEFSPWCWIACGSRPETIISHIWSHSNFSLTLYDADYHIDILRTVSSTAVVLAVDVMFDISYLCGCPGRR